MMAGSNPGDRHDGVIASPPGALLDEAGSSSAELTDFGA
jgi:hypothetical protein